MKSLSSEKAGEEWVKLGPWHVGSFISVVMKSVCLVREGLLGRDGYELGIERLM